MSVVLNYLRMHAVDVIHYVAHSSGRLHHHFMLPTIFNTTTTYQLSFLFGWW